MSSESVASIQQFLILAKSSKGKALTVIIQQVLNHPNIFVFGELLELQNVQSLKGSAEEPWLKLLEIFAYGTLKTYKESTGFPELSGSQLTKLKKLTIVTMAWQTKAIRYADLKRELDINETRELEDLIIECTYHEIIKGRLNQKNELLIIEYSIGRDVNPAEFNFICSSLTNWSNRANELLDKIDERLKHASFLEEATNKQKKEIGDRIVTIQETLKSNQELLKFGFDDVGGMKLQRVAKQLRKA
eukprot:TRINITY_DN1112_c1_g5_i1.p1 TRINITY_DN1112_c1_g5~~TRINITY_DN1112_c1_g5_i1.p1  ORF type:complete len:246 (+),score=124.50 TRINITY_DN1112_c1_g5_i1:133-870(+)